MNNKYDQQNSKYKEEIEGIKYKQIKSKTLITENQKN